MMKTPLLKIMIECQVKQRMESIRDTVQKRVNVLTDLKWDRLEAGGITSIPDQLLQEHENF